MVSYFLYLRFFSRYNTSSTSIYHYKISLFGVINLLLHRNFYSKKGCRCKYKILDAELLRDYGRRKRCTKVIKRRLKFIVRFKL